MFVIRSIQGIQIEADQVQKQTAAYIYTSSQMARRCSRHFHTELNQHKHFEKLPLYATIKQG